MFCGGWGAILKRLGRYNRLGVRRIGECCAGKNANVRSPLFGDDVDLALV